MNSGNMTGLEQDTYDRAYYDGRTLKEIAKSQGVSPQAVKMRLYRARKRGAQLAPLRAAVRVVPSVQLSAVA